MLFAVATALLLGGTQCAAAPTSITSCLEAQQLLTSNLTGTYQFTNHIDCSGVQWIPVDNFAGVLDGSIWQVSNLVVNYTIGMSGFFGNLSGSVRNLKFSSPYVVGTTYVGVLAGQLSGAASATGIRVIDGYVSGVDRVGGIVGFISTSSPSTILVSDVLRTVVTASASNAGGIAGDLAVGTVSEVSVYQVQINCPTYGGGLFGQIGASAKVERSSALEVNVTVDTFGGGVTGEVGGTAWAVTTSGSVVCRASACGGFAAKVSGNVTDCISQSSVSGSSPVGGFLGSDSGSGAILNRCISVGRVSGLSAKGFLGVNNGVTTINCFWNRETATVASDAGVATSLSSIQMMNPTNFPNFRFSSTWTMLSRPILQHQLVRYPSVELDGDCEKFALIGTIPEYLGAQIVMTVDIDCSLVSLSPIGTPALPFTGTFDGQNYVIKNVDIFEPALDYVGLFGFVLDGSLRHFRLESVSVVGVNYVGGVVGAANSTNMLDIVVVFGTIEGSDNVGGLAGAIYGGGSKYLLRVLGVDVTASGTVGGAVGSALSVGVDLIIARSGRVQSTGAGSPAGGLFGRVTSGAITQAASDNDVVAPGVAGGLVGVLENWALIENSYSLGHVSSDGGPTAVSGGLVGVALRYSNVSWCFASPSGALSSTGATGGLLGSENGTEIVLDSFWAVESAASTAGGKGSSIPVASLKNRTIFQATVGVGWRSGSWHFSPNSTAWYPQLGIPDEYTPKQPLSRCADLKLICRNEFSRAASWALVGSLNCSDPLSGLDDGSLDPLCGDSGPPFVGEFDGSGNSLSGLWVTGSSVSPAAIFSRVAGPAYLHDFTLFDCVWTGWNKTAGLVASLEPGSQLENITISESFIFGLDGALAALALNVDGSTITNCKLQDTLISSQGNIDSVVVAGLVGTAAVSVISGCSVARLDFERSDPLSFGVIGGLVGVLVDSEISNSFVTGLSLNVLGDVTGQLGGVVGSIRGSSFISRVYLEDSVINATSVSAGSGAFIGQFLAGSVNDCFVVSQFSPGQTASGGFVGFLGGGSIARTYSAVEFTQDISFNSLSGLGTFVGTVLGSAIVTGSFVDSTLAFAGSTPAGYVTNGSATPNVQPLSHVEMLSSSPFLAAGWNFSAVWSINEGVEYPRLQAGQGVPLPINATLTIVQRVSQLINSSLAVQQDAAVRFALVEQLLALLDSDINNAADMQARRFLRNCLLDSLSATTNTSLSAVVPVAADQLRVINSVATRVAGEIGPETARALCGLVSQVAQSASLFPNFSLVDADRIINTRLAVRSAEISVASVGSNPYRASCLSAGTSRASNLACLSLEQTVLTLAAALPPSGGGTVTASNITIVIIQTNGSSDTTIVVNGSDISVVVPGGSPGVITVIVYPPNQNPNTVTNGTQTVNLGTVVVSITITTLNGTIVQPPGGVTITIPPAPGLVEAKCTTPTCSYFDEAAGVWRSGGLTTNIVRDSSGQITSYECTTPHLTDFAVLLLAEDGCESVFAKYKDMFFAFAVLFGLFAVVSVVQTLRALIVSANDRSRSRATGFYRVAMLGAATCGLICRLVYTSMAASGGLEGASVASLVVLLSLPYYFLFVAFVTVIGQWIAMVGISTSTRTINVSMGLGVLAVSVVLAAMWAVAATAATTSQQADAAAQGSYVIGALCLAMAFGFVAAGGRILFQTSRLGTRSEKQRAVERKLYAVICAYSASFSAEAALWVYSIVALDSFSAHFLAFYVVFLLVELFTYSTMLYATRKFNQRAAKSGAHASTTTGTSFSGSTRSTRSRQSVPGALLLSCCAVESTSSAATAPSHIQMTTLGDA